MGCGRVVARQINAGSRGPPRVVRDVSVFGDSSPFRPPSEGPSHRVRPCPPILCPTSARTPTCAAGVSGLVGGGFFRNLVFGTAPSADTRERRAGLPSSMSCVGGDSRSASLPTRLETRTKESNLCASRGAKLRSPLPRRSESERSSIPAPQPARSLPSAPRQTGARSGAQRGPAPAA